MTRGPITDPRLTAVRLDVTDPEQVAEAATQLTDVHVVINNAGIARPATPLAADIDDAQAGASRSTTSACCGSRRRSRSAKVLVNVLSVASFRPLLSLSTYSASKAAAWSITNVAPGRADRHAGGRRARRVHRHRPRRGGPGRPKIPPSQVVEATLEAIAAGETEVLADDVSRDAKAALV